MSKKYIIPAVLIILALVTWWAFGSDTQQTAIIYASPQTGPFEVNITTSGELQAKNSTSIKGPSGMRDIGVYNATIQRLIPEGTRVKKGDFVAELDRSNVESALQTAQLNLQEKESTFEQAQLDSAITLSKARDNLVNLNYAVEQNKIVVQQSKYESPAVQRKAQINYEEAQRQYEQAQKNYVMQKKQAEVKLQGQMADLQKEKNKMAKIKKIMSQFTIYAPENGMVIYRRNRDGSKVTEGDQISAWRPDVAELPDFSVMQSVTYVNEVDIQKLKKGQKVDISLDAYPDKKLTGLVTSVANIGEQRPNSDSKVFQVIIRVNQSDSTLRPSMTTSNIIHVNSVDSALFVPLETVHTYHDSLSVVYKHEGARAVMQQVILGLINENQAIIKVGVKPSDQLYLSSPADTTNIKKIFLPDSVVQKYKKKKKQQQKKPDHPQRRHHFGGGHFPHPGGQGTHPQ